MDSNDLQQSLYNIVDEYDKAIKLHSAHKAGYEKVRDLKDSTLSVLMNAVEGSSEAERKRNALKTAKWSDYLVMMDDARLEYLKSDAKVKGLELKTKIYISLLSYSKLMAERTT